MTREVEARASLKLCAKLKGPPPHSTFTKPCTQPILDKPTLC